MELLGRVQTQQMDQLYYIWYLPVQMIIMYCSVILSVSLELSFVLAFVVLLYLISLSVFI